MELIGNDPLAVFLRSAAKRGFVWGQHDCLLFLADWVFQRTGNDPAGDLRWAYTSEQGAKRIIVKAGGMAPLIDLQMPGKRTDSPERGDIAVVDDQAGHTGAIVLAGSTVALTVGGLRIEPWPILAAWRV